MGVSAIGRRQDCANQLPAHLPSCREPDSAPGRSAALDDLRRWSSSKREVLDYPPVTLGDEAGPRFVHESDQRVVEELRFAA